MVKLQQMQPQVVGRRKEADFKAPSDNHIKTASKNDPILKEASDRGFTRAAGNIFVCPSSKDLWAARNGKLVRLHGAEVDNGERLNGAPSHNPAAFLEDALADLSF